MKKLNNWVILMLFMNPLILLSMNNWFSIWMNMEMNLLIFLTYMILNNKFLFDLPMKYFLINSFSSMMFFMFLNLMLFNNMIIYKSLMNLMLMVKLGMFPFYYWFLEFMIVLNWMSCFLLSVWQKLIPLYLMNLLCMKMMNFIFIMMNGMFSVFMVLNEFMLKKIISYSSINHLGWMIFSLMINLNLFLIYFLIYFLINLNLLVVFNKFNFFSLINLISYNMNFNYLKIFMMMSMGGLPPFWGFMMKFIMIFEMVSLMKFFIIFLLINFSLIFLFYYLRLVFNFMMMNFVKMKILDMKLVYNNFLFYMMSLNLINLMNLMIFFFY